MLNTASYFFTLKPDG
nr:unnamed protein product [Callosobruchus chinensis]